MKTNNAYKTIGEYRNYDKCRFCQQNILPVINLGYVPLAGGFIKKTKNISTVNKKFYPLELFFCSQCYLLQTNNVVDKEILFKDYYYHSSAIKTLIKHFESNVNSLIKLFPDTKKRFIVEIGCNDGKFISALSKKGFRSLGIDPASNIVNPLIKKGLPIINDYFSESLATKISKLHGKADAIVSFHTLAHIEDMHDVIRGIKILLKKDGFLAFEVHYLGNLINELQYDMIYHEHQFYYSTQAVINLFKMHGMEIFDAQTTPIRSGSIMYFVQKSKNGKRKISKNVKKIILMEKNMGLYEIATFLKFNEKIKNSKKDLVELLHSIKKDRKTIAGYGASGRGTIIMNYCGIGKNFLDYIIDDAPVKQGAYTPGTHLLIKSSAILKGKNKPDYLLVFAWPFFDEILKKNIKYSKGGGKFIIPIPQLKII